MSIPVRLENLPELILDMLLLDRMKISMKTTKAVLGIITISLALVAQVQAQSFLTNGLVAYYPFTVAGTDQSGHGLDLTLSNVLFSTVGPIGGEMRPSASFDGQSSYARVNQTLITGLTNWTWAAWLYAPQPTTNNPWPSIYQEGTQTGPCFGIDITPAEILHVGAWNLDLPNNWMLVDAPYGLTNGWNHVVLTLTDGGVGSGALSIYFNGVLTDTAVLQSLLPANASSVFGMIGNGWSDQGNLLAAPWKGSISDLRFYNISLPSNQVQQLYAYEFQPIVSLKKAVKPSFANLFLGANYQLQVSTDLNTWTNSGSPFTPTNSVMDYPQCFDADNWGELFFRLQVAP